MSEDYQGGCTVAPLENPEAFLRQLEQNRELNPSQSDQQQEYRQTTASSDLDQLLRNLEEGNNVQDSPPEMPPRRPVAKSIARKKYALVGKGPKVQANPRYVEHRQDTIYDALNPPPPGWRPPTAPKDGSKKLKGFI